MRKRLFILGAVLLSAITLSSAQITFQKAYGGLVSQSQYSVQQTTDGGYILAGKKTGASIYDIYLTKTDSNGDTLWTKIFGGIVYDGSYSVVQTNDEGYIIVGETQSFGAGDRDIYLIRADANGNLLWAKTFGGAVYDVGRAVLQTTDGGYIITGGTSSFGAGNNDVYLIKTDSSGNSLWTKTFGLTGSEYGYSVKQTSDGGYIITGYATSASFDVYLVKIDSTGNLLWSKTYGRTGYDQGNSVEQTTDGGYIITGFTTGLTSSGFDHVYLIKTDSIGNLLWSKVFGGTSHEVSYSVKQTTDGGYIVAAATRSFGAGDYDVYLIKTDSIGNLLWSKTFGGSYVDFGYSVQQTTDGGYIVGGYTNSFSTGGNFYLIKTNGMGNSGCNQSTPGTIVTLPATQVTSPATMVTSPATIVTTPATIVGSGGIVAAICTSVGVNEITTNNLFLLSPNPSEGNFIISFGGTIIKGHVEILNILGVPINIGIAENIFNESKKEIKLVNISKGIYFVKVFDGEKYYCKKIIIEHD